MTKAGFCLSWLNSFRDQLECEHEVHVQLYCTCKIDLPACGRTRAVPLQFKARTELTILVNCPIHYIVKEKSISKDRPKLRKNEKLSNTVPLIMKLHNSKDDQRRGRLKHECAQFSVVVD